MTDWQHKLVKTENLSVKILLQMAHPENAREHPEHQLEATEELIETIGLIDEIKVSQRSGKVINGHARIQIALQSGQTSLPVNWYDLTEDEERLALEQYDATTYEATYNPDKLRALMEKTKGIKADRPALQAIMERLKAREGIDGNGAETKAPPEVTETEAEKLAKQYGVKEGQVWQLGRHIIGCCDSTNSESVKRLFGERKADLWLTDPPYGVSYADKNKWLNAVARGNRVQTPIENDHESMDDLCDLWHNAALVAYEFTTNEASYYWFACQGGDQMMMMMMIGERWKVRHELIWLKNNHVLGRADYNYKHEPILYGWKRDGTHRFYGGFQTSVFEFDKPMKSDLHPTTKPLDLIARLIENSSQTDEIVYDGFLGSGTTLLACERLNRVCVGADIAPAYIGATIHRWSQMTNQDPVLLSE